jgi:hypothetical protein
MKSCATQTTKKLWASKVAALAAHVIPIKRNLIAHVLDNIKSKIFNQQGNKWKYGLTSNKIFKTCKLIK